MEWSDLDSSGMIPEAREMTLGTYIRIDKQRKTMENIFIFVFMSVTHIDIDTRVSVDMIFDYSNNICIYIYVYICMCVCASMFLGGNLDT